MDLVLMILRFLFGMPVEACEVEPIVVHADGRTSSGRRRFVSQYGVQSTIGASTHRRRFLHSKPGSSGGFRERLFYFWRIATRSVSRRQDDCRTSRT
jgi:hypothetical protein